MAAQLFYMPFLPVPTQRGLPAGGARAFFYVSGTTTLAPVYSDAALTTALPNPVVADALGRLPDIYLSDALVYRVRVLDAKGAQIGADVDPYYAGQAVTITPSLPQLLAPDGSGKVGFLQLATQASSRTVESKLREGPITPDDFPLLANDTLRVQAALNARGLIQLNRAYTITAPLTIRGNTQIVGKPGAKLVWSGPPADCVLQDSSAAQKRAGQPTTDINLNILLENFEIVGGAYQTGGTYQVGIDFFRTGNVTIRGVAVHGIGGSGIRWGNSQTDTQGILVENCEVYDCRYGDAIQGVGRAIVIRNNRIGQLGSTTSNFGDSGIALLYDFSSVTNPGGGYTTDVEISGNTIIGNYDLAGQYVGTGQQIQTGIAFGPFKNGHAANVRVIGNTLFGCYLNLWVIVMDDVLIAQNNFGSHSATATGNIRFDGVTNLRAKDNIITLRLASTGPDYCGILLVAQRNVYGASVFDSDVSRFEVSGNAISSIQPNIQGIRATFESVNTSPTYVSKLTTGRFEDNVFINITTPVSLAPQTGATAAVCSDVSIRGNKVDGNAARIVMAGGGTAQYVNARIRENPAPGVVPPATGTGAPGLKWSHAASGKAMAAASGTAVDLVTLPSGNYSVQVAARVPDQNNATLSATATVHVNGTGARSTADNGAAMTLTLNGLTIRATQTGGGTADITYDLQYTL